MIRTGSLFSQILSLFQRPNFARHVRELKAEYHARGEGREPRATAVTCLASAKGEAAPVLPAQRVHPFPRLPVSQPEPGLLRDVDAQLPDCERGSSDDEQAGDRSK